ncbi:penicillin-binding transpeptidase domain-containing protein [Pseudalkalibacillus berkeleyi]|uniref:Penicillin-binding transpeptidase domain-containing protein n=1 Tax=Pseudalkalibacillus berkeleyi TaxID=1069813 RepID=A0ABS9H4V5_9BACL|nr:penicillin-binding transpeptidase domain-containing protein [Pseudalkalibacillus berkeleyi]MCF6138862.1 penicillin-binding transpeptidase domain-containing protein [Pseudalkalibacillus berkeleyi]
MRKLVFLIICLIALVGCSDKPKPETTFESYMKAWEKQDYEKMYSYITEEKKKEFSKKEFTETYTTSYEEIKMSDLEVTYKLPKEEKEYDEEDKPSFNYVVKMETIAGPIESSYQTDLVFEKGEEADKWSINWNPSNVLVGMKKGDQVKAIVSKPERAEIFDVNGEGLAVNGVIQEVGLVPAWMKEDAEEVKEKLAKLIDVPIEKIDAKLNQSWVKPDSYVPLGAVAADDHDKIEAIRPLNGTKFVEKKARVYPLKSAAAHLTGYVDLITKEQLEKKKDKGYKANDVIGKSGLELIFEEELRGDLGGEIVIKDAEGNIRDILAKQEPVKGKDITLTVDASIQSLLYSQMQGDAGSAAAIHPTTGEVLALVSTPSYDPNFGVTGNKYTRLSEDPLKPLTNRFTSTYAPGSTFKPITAAIGVETGLIKPAEEKQIPANNRWQKDNWGDHFVTRVKSPDTKVNLEDALVRSDNIYFAKAILDIGGDAFLRESKKFGFDEKIPFPIGISKSKITNEGFKSEGQLADTGYGQGQVEMSSLHLGLTYTPFINNGAMIKPILFADETKSQTWKENVMTEETAKTITKDLVQVIEKPYGTGHEPKLANIKLAGKTGTAELKKSKEAEGKENGWFVAWNTENPQLLISMMIEDVKDREGSHYVVPKVKKVFQGMLGGNE